ncbi:RNA polymerase sigma factor [Nocardioides pocheonensis]|uniref:RNA polymerase sigma factor n=1 Tax=Nocardioides pocheonensis TaxID=661485 RepID=A0A3N0GRM6_9ACTN|nr:RNA polymerase sigma factor [Nocardioides pocheonensis]RNM15061.1 RNA polymerase sigma factor [Nocardioides pocheonensis]
MSDPTPADTVTTTWRREAAVLVAALTRMTRDVGLAEDLAQDALVAALEQWPAVGVPDNPGAWLMTTAKRRAVDHFRRADTLRRKTEQLGHALLDEHGREEGTMPDLDAQVDHIEDDVLRLIFLCCHPALTPDSRAALTLRMVGGLTTGEIARAFLVSETTMGQRISRAKRTLGEVRAEFELPTGDERAARLDDVMAVVYLIFNEGYAATAGDDWMRPELTTEAIRLARMLSTMVPDEPEVHGLQALLEIQASRSEARTDAEGRPVLLEDQDRSLWDELLIRRGLAALERAELLAARGRPVGRYYLQAAIASRHARARTAEETDWKSISSLYDVLAEVAPGPVVEVNRAVAHGRAFDAGAGLAVLDAIAPDALSGSPLVPSVRGDLLARLGHHEDAAAAFREAAACSDNQRERELLTRRAEENEQKSAGPMSSTT